MLQAATTRNFEILSVIHEKQWRAGGIRLAYVRYIGREVLWRTIISSPSIAFLDSRVAPLYPQVSCSCDRCVNDRGTIQTDVTKEPYGSF